MARRKPKHARNRRRVAKRRPSSRKQLQRVRDKLSDWTERADKAARRLARYRRPDLVRKAEREGRAAEKKLREYEKKEKRLTRAKARADERKRERKQKERKPKKKAGERAPGKYLYHPKVSYGKLHHNATVEISFHRRDFARMSDEEVQSAVYDLAKGKGRDDLVLDAVWYGRDDATKRGARRDLQSLIGVVLSGDLETIGEEEKQK